MRVSRVLPHNSKAVDSPWSVNNSKDGRKRCFRWGHLHRNAVLVYTKVKLEKEFLNYQFISYLPLDYRFLTLKTRLI